MKLTGKIFVSLLILAVLAPAGFVLAASGSPSIYTGSVTNITETSAVLSASANPRGSTVRVWFDWGPASLGLVHSTPVQTLSGSDNGTEFLAGIGNLTPGVVYFFRSVAQTGAGVYHGDTRSFKTNAVSVSSSRSSSSGGIFGRTAQAAQPAVSLVAINISTDKSKVDRGEDFVLNIAYQNIGSKEADDVVLKVTLPKDISLSVAQPVCYLVEKNSLVFNLGRVSPAETETINLGVKTSDSADFGDTLKINAVLSYIDMGGAKKEEVSDNLSILVQEKTASAMPAAVGFLSVVYDVWFVLSLVVNVFLVFYIFYLRRKNTNLRKLDI